jgi:hypothetical protein
MRSGLPGRGRCELRRAVSRCLPLAVGRGGARMQKLPRAVGGGGRGGLKYVLCSLQLNLNDLFCFLFVVLFFDR